LFVTLELSTVTERKTFSNVFPMRSYFILVVLVLVTYATKEDDIRAYLATCSTKPTKLALKARFHVGSDLARRLINEAVIALLFLLFSLYFCCCVGGFVVSVPFCLYFVSCSRDHCSYYHCFNDRTLKISLLFCKNICVHCSVVR
jgi:hypothetical protein